MASQSVKDKLLDNNAVPSLQIACKSLPYADFIKSINIHPELIVHYYSTTLITQLNFENCCISIDATGGIDQSVKPPKRLVLI